MGGPEMAPHTPPTLGPPRQAVTALDIQALGRSGKPGPSVRPVSCSLVIPLVAGLLPRGAGGLPVAGGSAVRGSLSAVR
jgi:hypothetical protein